MKVQSDKLRLLYKQSYQAVFFSLSVAFIYAAILWQDIDRTALVIWLSSILVSSLFRLILFFSYRKLAPQEEDILKWELPYYITLIISSLVWGLGTTILVYDADLHTHVITLLFLIGMAGSALSVYSSIQYFTITTISIILLPCTLLLILQDSQKSILIAIGAILFYMSAVRATNILTDILHKTFLLTHQLTLAKNKAEQLASTDALTGLNNRRSFTEQSEVQIQYCNRHHYPVSVLLLDLDHFKKINDKFGHAAGDKALQQLAGILRKATRISDICGRIGGEEFSILLPNTDANNASVVAEKLRQSIENTTLKLSGTTYKITASIGIATGNHKLDTLIKTADDAMYQAKESGRNKVIAIDIKPDLHLATAPPPMQK